MKKPFVTDILRHIAPKIGAKLLIEPEYGFVGQITFRNGRKALFKGTNFNINHLGSVEIARDKFYSSFFLRTFGYKVPDGLSFFSDKLNENLRIKRTIHDGFDFAKRLGFPVILKPNNLSQGTLVTKVYAKKEFFNMARTILERSSVAVVERFYEGRDYRIVVLDNDLISAYQRIPLHVVGDGRLSVVRLLRKKQFDFEKDGRDTVLNLKDIRINMSLKRQGLCFRSIPKKGECVRLLDNANLSTGGEAIDVSSKVHPMYKNLAIRITKDMGLRLCGVDIICGDISQPVSGYVVIEVNGAPGLDNYASLGRKQKQLVQTLYLRVLKALENDRTLRK